MVLPLTDCALEENDHLCNPKGRRDFPTHLMEKYIEMYLDFVSEYNLTLINEASEHLHSILKTHVLLQLEL